MFSEVEGNVWDHVAIAYSKCDDMPNGRFVGDDGINRKKKALLEAIQHDDRRLNCKVDIPIFTLSGVEAQAADIEKSKDFESLWQLLQEKPDMSTEELQKFDGLGN